MIEGRQHEPEADEPSDELLAQRAAGGCRESFARLVDRFANRLNSFLTQRLGHVQDAEDMTQETLLKAYRNLGRYSPRWRFSTWLFTIAAREAVSRQRRRGRRREMLTLTAEPADEQRPDAVLAAREEAVNAWVLARACLPAEVCAAMWLRYAESMPVGDVARAMGWTQVRTRVSLHRARTKLVRRLNERESHPRSEHVQCET